MNIWEYKNMQILDLANNKLRNKLIFNSYTYNVCPEGFAIACQNNGA